MLLRLLLLLQQLLLEELLFLFLLPLLLLPLTKLRLCGIERRSSRHGLRGYCFKSLRLAPGHALAEGVVVIKSTGELKAHEVKRQIQGDHKHKRHQRSVVVLARRRWAARRRWTPDLPGRPHQRGAPPALFTLNFRVFSKMVPHEACNFEKYGRCLPDFERFHFLAVGLPDFLAAFESLNRQSRTVQV